jgi:hypothetical protein
MAEQWNFYFTNRLGYPASIFLDLAVKNYAPNLSKPTLIVVFIFLRVHRDDGLSHQDEFDALCAVEDAICLALSNDLQAQNVGRITAQGRRDVVFYAPNANNLTETIQNSVKEFIDYRVESSSAEDRTWSAYMTMLYPNNVEYQFIQNSDLVQSLKSHGDDGSTPREIVHWLYFPTSESRTSFLNEAAKHGFSADSEDIYDSPENELPFAIQVTRTDKASQPDIDHVTARLVEWGTQSGGEYDGWETQIITK